MEHLSVRPHVLWVGTESRVPVFLEVIVGEAVRSCHAVAACDAHEFKQLGPERPGGHLAGMQRRDASLFAAIGDESLFVAIRDPRAED